MVADAGLLTARTKTGARIFDGAPPQRSGFGIMKRADAAVRHLVIVEARLAAPCVEPDNVGHLSALDCLAVVSAVMAALAAVSCDRKRVGSFLPSTVAL